MKTIIYFSAVLLCARYVTNTCLETGRFPNNSEPDCRGFTMCLRGAAGFMQYNLVCPENFIFSHIERQCTNVTSYKCLPNYNCTNDKDILNIICNTTYTECIKDLNNVSSARLIQCQSNTVFNGSVCVDREMYPCTLNTEKPTTVISIKNIEGNFTFNVAVSWSYKHLTIVYTFYVFYLFITL